MLRARLDSIARLVFAMAVVASPIFAQEDAYPDFEARILAYERAVEADRLERHAREAEEHARLFRYSEELSAHLAAPLAQEGLDEGRLREIFAGFQEAQGNRDMLRPLADAYEERCSYALPRVLERAGIDASAVRIRTLQELGSPGARIFEIRLRGLGVEFLAPPTGASTQAQPSGPRVVRRIRPFPLRKVSGRDAKNYANESGDFRTFASYVFVPGDGSSSSTTIGSWYMPSTGTSSAHIEVEVDIANATAFAAAGLGAASSGARMFLRVFDGSTTTHMDSVELARFFAPVAWGGSRSVKGTFHLDSSLPVSRASGPYLITMEIEASAVGAGLFSMAEIDVEGTLIEFVVTESP